MKFKKILVTAVLALFIAIPGFATDETTPIETPASIRGQVLLNRLEEIKGMDVKSMSTSEKKVLRKEVRSIEKEMKRVNNGVYISVGGIIIIILLLILLL